MHVLVVKSSCQVHDVHQCHEEPSSMNATTIPDDWIYAGEGGAHVIFSCRPKTRPDDEEEESSSVLSRQPVDINDSHAVPLRPAEDLDDGTLLRVKKRDIVSCLNAHCPWDKEEQGGAVHQNRRVDPSRAIMEIEPQAPPFVTDASTYVERMVVPALSPSFVDVPRRVRVPARFAGALARRTLDSGRIPPHRQASWQCVSGTTTSKECDTKLTTTNQGVNGFISGLLIRDYRLPRRFATPPIKPTRTTISIEIKPKAGYTATSPLVDRNRRVKYHTCRYQLLHGMVSNYNPLDLYSHNLNRIRQALQALIQQPRNNFRLWVAHNDASNNLKQVDLSSKEARNDVSLQPLSWHGWSVDTVADVVAGILHKEETFLRQLQGLQTLDVVDSDGAIRLYHRLVHAWCQGSHEQACRLLDVISTTTTAGSASRKNERINLTRYSFLDSFPSALWADLDSCGTNLYQYLDIVQQLERYKSSADKVNQTDIKDEWLDAMHQEAVRLVENMNMQDCMLLLRMWLLSLAMCDVSFFVSLHIPDETSSHNIPMNGPSPDDKPETMVLDWRRSQSSNEPGMMMLGCQNEHQVCIAYEIKVIDCDQKPANKLKSRGAKEDEVFTKLKSSASSTSK